MSTETANRKFIPALSYQWLTPFYDFFLRLTMPEDRIRRALISAAKVLPEFAVLDFGCGSATLTIMLKELFPYAPVTGIDVDPQILERAKEKVANAGVQVKLIQYDGEKLPFPADSFDLMVSCLVFHHLYGGPKKSVLRQLYQALRPEGQLIIADFGRSANLLQRLLFMQIRLLDGFKPTAVHAKGELPLLITAAGFKEVCILKNFRTMFGEVQIIIAKK